MTTTSNISRIETLSAATLLAIREDEPEYLFTGDADALKSEYRALSKIGHPDLNKDAQAQAVFAHINKLHVKAKDKIAAATWATPGLLELSGVDGHSYKVRYAKKHTFELGAFYISRTVVTFVIDKAIGGDLAENGISAIKNIRYADDKLRKEFVEKMPSIVKNFETKDATVVVIKKDPDMVLLSDLQDYIVKTTGQTLISKHAAWIMSRLHSMTCFFQVNGQTHNAITSSTVFVSPAMHTAALLGGWWYAAKEGAPLKGLPGDALASVPADVLAEGKATRRIDLEMIRSVGRDVLGDVTGSLILRDARVPKPMAQWLTNTSSGNAFKDFQNWSEDVLKSSFGPRRFTELKVSFGDVYQPL